MSGLREGDVFYFYGRENGLTTEREWTVLYSTIDTLVIYYCIDMKGQEAEGVLVMSTSFELKKERIALVAEHLARVNLSFSDMC